MAHDLAEAFLHGVSIAHEATQAKARLQQERAHVQMEAQARAQTQEQENLREHARLQTQSAYHDAQIGLAQQRLQQQAQQAQAKAKQAAMMMADQHGLAQDLFNGVPIEKALFNHPNANPSEAFRMADEQLREHGFDLQAQHLKQEAEKEKRLANPETKPTMETTTSIYPHQDAVEGTPATHSSLGGWWGKDAPAIPGTPYQPERRVTVRKPIGVPTPESLSPGGAAPAAVPDAPLPPVSAKSPHADNTIVTNKKTGARAMVVNGQLVPIDQAAPNTVASTDDAGNEGEDNEKE